MKRLWALLLMMCALAAFAFAGEQLFSEDKQYVVAQPVESVTLQAGSKSVATLRFRIRPGFHINSHKPNSDLLIATAMKIEPPTDVMVGQITYPPGKDLALPFDPKEKISVYSDDLTVQAQLIASAKAPLGEFTVHGTLRYQACNDRSCFPPKDVPVEFNVTVTPAAKTSSTGHPKRH